MCQGSATCPSDAPVPPASWACGPSAAGSPLPEATYCPFPWGRAPAISCCPSPATRVPDSPRGRNQPHRPVALGAHLDLTSYFDRSASPAASIFGPSLHIQLLLTSVCCHPSLSPVWTPAISCKWPPHLPSFLTRQPVQAAHRTPCRRLLPSHQEGSAMSLSTACGICPCPLAGLISCHALPRSPLPTCPSHADLLASPLMYQVRSHFRTSALLSPPPKMLLPQITTWLALLSHSCLCTNGISSGTASLTTLSKAAAPPLLLPSHRYPPFISFTALARLDLVIKYM